MARRTLPEIRDLVAKHNKSKKLSNDFVVCLIWKETSFDDTVKNPDSSATGLMQVTRGAVDDVNTHMAPDGVTYSHDDMTDAAKNIECGTYYLDLRIRWAHNLKKGVDAYGTGHGYSTRILKCEACMKKEHHHKSKKQKDHSQSCLFKIHM
jgi:soluble lytic murein transglycosylase-like protein